MNFDKKIVQWGVLLALAAVWGSSFILMKKGLESYSYMQVAAARLVIAWLVLLPLALPHFRKLDRKYIIPLIAVGTVGNGLPAFLFTKAQTVLASSLAGMLNSLVPLFAIILGLLFFGVRTNMKSLTGVLLGLAGACALFLAKGTDNFFQNGSYAFLVVLATMGYATSVNVIKKYLHDLDSVAITAIALCFAGPPAAVYLFSTDFVVTTTQTDGAWLNLAYIAILGIFGTALAIVLFNMLIKHTSMLFAASVTYLIPIVAILWGLGIGEEVNLIHLAGMATILFGVYLVNRAK